MLDRFDLRVEVPPVAYRDLDVPEAMEGTAEVADRVTHARALQDARFADIADMSANADIAGDAMAEFATPDAEGRDLLNRVAEKFGLSARGYHRVLRVARTIADLAGSEPVLKSHVAEAVGYRLAVTRLR